jgi:hypothetical protein
MGAICICGDIEEIVGGNQAVGNEKRERGEVSVSDPCSPSEIDGSGVKARRACVAIDGKQKDTYRMTSGGSCCQDLLDSLPLYCEVGGDIRAVYASVARVVTLIRRR